MISFLAMLFTTAWAGERLAVLEVRGADLPADQCATLTDAARQGVVGALGDRVVVMTRENMEVMLSDMGLDASCVAEGSCEVDTARNLGVDYVVSGSLTPFGGVLVASLKLHETKGGSLLGSEQVRGADALALLDAMPAGAGKLVGRLAAVAPTSGPTASGSSVQPAPTVVAPASDPVVVAAPKPEKRNQVLNWPAPNTGIKWVGDCKWVGNPIGWRCPKASSAGVYLGRVGSDFDLEAYCQDRDGPSFDDTWTSTDWRRLTTGLPGSMCFLDGKSSKEGRVREVAYHNPAVPIVYACAVKGDLVEYSGCAEAIAGMVASRVAPWGGTWDAPATGVPAAESPP
jgi:hypothetical protein